MMPRLYTKQNINKVFRSDYTVIVLLENSIRFTNNLTSSNILIPCSTENGKTLIRLLEHGVDELELIEFFRNLGNEDYYYLLVQKGVIG